MCRSLHWVEFWWRQNKDFLRFLNKIKYSEKPTSKLNQSDDKVLTYWTSFLYNSKCVLPEKKITLSMKSHLVSFLCSFWHYKKKINFHKMQLKKTVLPSPVNCKFDRRYHPHPFAYRDYYWTELLDEFAAMTSKLFYRYSNQLLDWWFFSTKTYSG